MRPVAEAHRITGAWVHDDVARRHVSCQTLHGRHSPSAWVEVKHGNYLLAMLYGAAAVLGVAADRPAAAHAVQAGHRRATVGSGSSLSIEARRPGSNVVVLMRPPCLARHRRRWQVHGPALRTSVVNRAAPSTPRARRTSIHSRETCALGAADGSGASRRKLTAPASSRPGFALPR